MDALSSLPDCSSSVATFIQSLDLLVAGTMGVVDLAVADMLLEGKKLGVKARTSLIFIDPSYSDNHSGPCIVLGNHTTASLGPHGFGP